MRSVWGIGPLPKASNSCLASPRFTYRRSDRRRPMKDNKTTFPKDPLERCHQRWNDLFFGVWRSLNRKKKGYRIIQLRIIEALKKYGLFDEKNFSSGLFEPNPTDEILKKVSDFYETKENQIQLHSVRGKKLPWETVDPETVLFYYWVVVGVLSKPFNGRPLTKINNPNARKLRIKERLLKVFPPDKPYIPDKLKYEISEKLLNQCIRFPLKEIAVRVVADYFGKKPDALRKDLTKAKRNNPSLAQHLAQVCGHGIEMIETE
jgi:hypothetical protein